MKRVRSGIVVGLTMATLGIGATSSSAGQLNLVPILQISGQYSDNVFFESDANKKSDTFVLINPGIGLDYASKRMVASFAYQVGLQRYNDFSDRDNTVHRIDASMGFNLSKGWYVNANDNLFVTNDPLAYDASGDRIQRDSYTYNHFTPNLAYTFGSHDWRLGARYDRIDIDYDTLTDSHQDGWGANVSAKAGARATVGFDYFNFKRYFDHQEPALNVVNYEGNRYGGHADYRISSHVSASGFAGYEKREFADNPDQRNFHSGIFDVALTGEFPSVFSWTVGGGLHLNDLAIQGAYKVKRVNFELRRSVAERLRLDFSGYWQNSENDQIPEEADFHGFRGEGQYLVAKFLNVWLGYEYTNRNGSTNLDDFTENRVNFGLTLSYGL